MNDIREKLRELTGKSEEEVSIINDILNSHFIIGKNNKEKIIEDFKNKLSLSYKEADELYNKCSEIIVKGIFKREK